MDCEIYFRDKSDIVKHKHTYTVSLNENNDLFYILLVGTFPWCSLIRFVCQSPQEGIRSRYLMAKMKHLDCRVTLLFE